MRYDIKHPVFNDRDFIFWGSQDINCWPSILVIGPHTKPILKLTGEGNRDDIENVLWAALEHYKSNLDKKPLPIELEKDKWLENRDKADKNLLRPE